MSEKKNSPPDEYYEKLPGILSETENEVKRLRKKMRSQARRSLAFVFISLMLAAGTIGAGAYLGMNWHNAEIKKAVATEKEKQKVVAKEVRKDEKTKKKDHSEDEKTAPKEIPKESPQVSTMDEAFIYTPETREFFLNLNGKKFAVPVKANDLEAAGWEMLGEEEVDENTLRSTFIDEAGGSLSFYHDKNTQAMKAESNTIEVVFDVEGLNLLSLNSKSTEIDVARLFAGAENANGDNYYLDTKTGTVIYSYGDIDISVNIASGLVTGVRVAKVR